jgi:DNA (cytosine-5)-methyltransferase 3A
MINGGSYITDIDILIGWSPCQDLSIAKKWGLWLLWEKSNLFYEYIRILNEVKPKYFLLENVNSMKKEDRDEITRIIWVEPIMINSALVSAQNRKRLYWTNIPWINQPDDRWIILKSILEPIVNEKYLISEKHTNAMIQSRNCKKLNIADPDTKSSCITASYFKIPNDAPYIQTVRVWHFNSGWQGDRVYSSEWKSVALSANGGGRGAKTGLYEIPPVVRKLTPTECERLQTIPDGYTDWVSNSQRYKAIGNGWTVDVIAHIFSHIKQC